MRRQQSLPLAGVLYATENVLFQDVISIICLHDDVVQALECVFTEIGVDEKQDPASSEVVNSVTQAKYVVMHLEG